MYLTNINENILNINETKEIMKIAEENIAICVEFEQEQIALESVIPWDNFLVRGFRSINRMMKVLGDKKVAFDLSLLAKVNVNKMESGDSKTKMSKADIELYLKKVVDLKLTESELKEAKDIVDVIGKTAMAEHKWWGKLLTVMNTVNAVMGGWMLVPGICGLISLFLQQLAAKQLILEDKETIDLIKRSLKLLAKIINRLVGISGDKFTEDTVKQLKEQANTLPKGGTNTITEAEKKSLLDKISKITKDHANLLSATGNNIVMLPRIMKVSKDMLKHTGQVDEYNVEQLEILVRVLPEYFLYMNKFADFSKQVIVDIRKF